MNAGISFPSNSVHEFYSYGGSGGFGSPFVAPHWGFASNFPSSSSSSYSSHVSAHQVTESVIKKEPPVVEKKEKTPIEIYDEEAFSDKPKADKIAFQIYEETAFAKKPKSEMSRLTKKERIEIAKLNNSDLNKAVEEGDAAEKRGDYRTEALMHREVQEQLSKLYSVYLRFTDSDAIDAYAYNSLNIHHPSLIKNIINNSLSLDEVFYYSKEDNWYFIKEKYRIQFNIDPKSDVLFDNRHLLPHNRKK